MSYAKFDRGMPGHTIKARSRLSILLLLTLSSNSAMIARTAHEEYNIVLELCGRKDYNEAILRLKAIIQTEPSFHRAYARMVTVSKELNQIEDTSQYFQLLTKNRASRAYTAYGAGLILSDRKDYQNAIINFKQSIAGSPTFTAVFSSLIDDHKEIKKLDQAEEYLSAIVKKHPKYAYGYYGLGYLRQLQTRWDEAIGFYDRALSMDSNLLDALYGKGSIYFLTGKSKQAIEVLGLGAKLASRGQLTDLESEGKFKNGLGQAYEKQGNYQKALRSHQEALEIYKRIGDRWGENETTNLVGKVYSRMGNYQTALDHFSCALAIGQSLGSRKQQSDALKGIAIAYYYLGKFEQSLVQSQLALDLYHAIEDRQGEAIMVSCIAIDYAEIGDYQRALEHAQRAAKMYAEIKDRPNQLITIGNMGTIYYDLGEYQNALACFKESMEIAKSVGDRNGQAVLFRLLGTVHREMGDYQRALEHYQKSLDIFEEVNSVQQLASTLHKMGLVHTEVGQYTKAIKYLDRSLTLAKRTGVSGAIWEAHSGLAEAYENQKLFGKALEHFKFAIEMIEDVRNRLNSAEHKSGFLQDKIDVYQKLCNLLLTLHQKFPEKSYYRSAFYYSEKSKAQALLDLLPQGQMINQLKAASEEFRQTMARVDRALKDQHGKMLQKREELASKEGKSKELIHTIEAHIEELQTKIDKLEQEKINSFNQMKERFPDYVKLYDPEVLHVESVQKDILKGGEVLIEYLVGEKNTLVFIINKQGLAYEQLSVGRNRLKEMIKNLGGVFSLVDSTEGKEKRSLKELSNIQLEKARDLYDTIFKPVEKHLRKGSGVGGQGSDKLVIVPDDVLNYVPFEMLVTMFEGYKAHYLIENYSMSYAYSASLLNPKLKKKTQAPELDLLAMGNPDFGAMMLRLGFPEINFTKEEVDQLVNRRAGTAVPVNGFSQLPYADFEVNAISQLVRKKKVFRNEQATERCFKDFAGKARVIHLATHSIVERANPLYSRIVFATNPSINQKGEDSNLYAYEIFDLNLAADLVVLSGCETGLGRLRRGEGLEGISRAFLYAGAPALVASLWKVADKEPTPLLMIKFYKNLAAGMDKRAALQKAKRELIAEGKYDNPFYWAPFILIGDVSPVPLSRPFPSWPTLLIGFGILIAVVQTYFLGISLKRRKPPAKTRT